MDPFDLQECLCWWGHSFLNWNDNSIAITPLSKLKVLHHYFWIWKLKKTSKELSAYSAVSLSVSYSQTLLVYFSLTMKKAMTIPQHTTCSAPNRRWKGLSNWWSRWVPKIHFSQHWHNEHEYKAMETNAPCQTINILTRPDHLYYQNHSLFINCNFSILSPLVLFQTCPV